MLDTLELRRYIADRDILQHNIRLIREIASKTHIWAVLKGNGYGLGLINMAQMLHEQNIDRFCVADVEEVRALCNAGFGRCRILMLQPTQNPELLRELVSLNVICTVSCLEDALALNEIAERTGRTAEVHVKVDTGMGRYGFKPEETEQILQVYAAMEHLYVSGIYTHFSCSGCSKRKTRRQFALFQRLLEDLKARKIELGEAHCCNSAAFFQWPQMYMDGVRIGSAWLGRTAAARQLGLKPVGYCESRVAELHMLKRGDTSGYCGAWKARRDTILAIVPVGWYHGFGVEYNRDTFRFRDCVRGCLSWMKALLTGKRLWVQVNGQKCPVCGHVGMLYTAVDVSRISCAVGDPVTLNISPLLQKGMSVSLESQDVTQSLLHNV